MVCLASFISPYSKDRQKAREIHETSGLKFFEVYLSTPIEVIFNNFVINIICILLNPSQVCEQRDVKGLYKKAREGQIKGFTGIDSVYEPPEHPSLVLDTSKLSVPECVQRIIDLLTSNDVIPAQAVESVKELFVAEDRKEELLEAAALMQRMDINKLDMQWLQVRVSQYKCVFFNFSLVQVFDLFFCFSSRGSL